MTSGLHPDPRIITRHEAVKGLLRAGDEEAIS
jgi:hypothetical protein